MKKNIFIAGLVMIMIAPITILAVNNHRSDVIKNDTFLNQKEHISNLQSIGGVTKNVVPLQLGAQPTTSVIAPIPNFWYTFDYYAYNNNTKKYYFTHNTPGLNPINILIPNNPTQFITNDKIWVKNDVAGHKSLCLAKGITKQTIADYMDNMQGGSFYITATGHIGHAHVNLYFGNNGRHLGWWY